MDHCQLLNKQERIALAAAAGVAAVSLLSAMLWLFEGVQPGQVWAGLAAPPAGIDPACIAADPRQPVCQRQVASEHVAVPPSPRRGA